MKHFFGSWVLAIFVPISALATVDMRNANYADTWNDFIAPGTGYDLRIQRVYNSRTLYTGMYGFGWCSDFETRMEINAEGNLRVVECGGGSEITFVPKSFSPNAIKTTISTIIAEVKKRNPSRTKKYLSSLKVELKENKYLREEFARQLKLEGKVSSNVSYIASGRENDSVILKNKIYIRSLPDGTFQRFNKKGKLIAMYDKNGNHLKLKYSKDKVASVTDNNGRKLSFKYYPNSKHVKTVTGPNGLAVSYKYKNDNLVDVTNAWKNKFTYAYDGLHNITKINFPDGTSKVLTYNNDKDWVTSFKNRKGCLETYTYESSKRQPLDHYWSTVKKVCNKKVTNNSRYEFWHKKGKSGERYLYRAKSTINGRTTDVTYHEVFGRPLSIYAAGFRTLFDYYKNGLVKSKRDNQRISKFSYKNNCKKVSRVETSPIIKKKKTKGKKSKRTLAGRKKTYTDFYYDEPKCNLIRAKASNGQMVQIKYDVNGRIFKIKDQSKKVVNIKYDARFGKPSFIERPGLGSIKVSYKPNGTVNKTISKDGPHIARQVASVFNNLLEIISPATSELNL